MPWSLNIADIWRWDSDNVISEEEDSDNVIREEEDSDNVISEEWIPTM